MKHYPVLAEFVDTHTGKRVHPGVPFMPKDEAQRTRLTDARCLGKDAVTLSGKPIADMSRRELEAAAVDTFTGQLARMSDDELRRGIERAREHLNDQSGANIVPQGTPADPADAARQQIGEGGQVDPADAARQQIGGSGQVDPADTARQQVNEDGLFDETVDRLKEIAAGEQIDLGSATKKADIIAAIRSKRAA